MANEQALADHLLSMDLRTQIAERRRNRYGAAPATPSVVSDAEWYRIFHAKSRGVKLKWRAEPGDSYVYFIQSEQGPVKIGISAAVRKRLSTLQSAHPAKLHLRATICAGPSIERAYHRRFAAHRLHGEWFAPHPDILAEIERLKGMAA